MKVGHFHTESHVEVVCDRGPGHPRSCGCVYTCTVGFEDDLSSFDGCTFFFLRVVSVLLEVSDGVFLGKHM
jgi:hypothetical protein